MYSCMGGKEGGLTKTLDMSGTYANRVAIVRIDAFNETQTPII